MNFDYWQSLWMMCISFVLILNSTVFVESYYFEGLIGLAYLLAIMGISIFLCLYLVFETKSQEEGK